MQLRPRQPDRDDSAPRLNLLLTSGRWDRPSVMEQLPHLLEPLGISSLRASSGEEAADVIRHHRIHIAVVDLSMPLCSSEPARTGGPKLLQLIRHLQPVPPTVVVRPPNPAPREDARTLSRALREGAFAVLDRPLELEAMLEVMRRILRRHYRGCWPGQPADSTNPPPDDQGRS